LAITLALPNIYTATTRVLPPQQNNNAAAALLGQLGGLGAVGTGALGIKNPGELYIGMLKSRSVADSLIERFKLQELFETRTLEDTRRTLSDVTDISWGRDGIISISVSDTDPKRASEIANGYVQQLHSLTDRLAVTEAAQRRHFFEKELSTQKSALATAEVELKKTQERTGLIKLDEQGKAIIEAVAHIRAQIAAKEVQLAAMRAFSTERNPDLVRLEMEAAGLRGELVKLEQSSGGKKSGTFVPTGQVPELGLEYVRKLRDVKYNETLFELLAKQYELARLDEGRDTGMVQVMDAAIPPDKKSKPQRLKIVLLTGFVVGFLGLILAFILEAFRHAQADPVRAERIKALKALLSLARRAG
jgi:tyrosine-protein kinase Etk/Wzc